MLKRFSTRFASLLLAGLLLSSCFGNFALTRTVYDLNSRVKNPYLQSAVTWLFIYIPVYGVAAAADFLVLNVIQFWTGSNPLRASHTLEDGTRLASETQAIDGQQVLVIHTTQGEGHTQRLELRKVDELALHARLLDSEGTLVEESTFPMTEMSAEKLTELTLRH